MTSINNSYGIANQKKFNEENIKRIYYKNFP